MFDIGWTEMAVIAIVALIVIGPKDLPKVLKTIGHWVGKARAMAREFQSGIDDIVREAELDEVKKQLESTRNFSLDKEIENTIDPTGTIKDAFKLEETEAAQSAGAKSPGNSGDGDSPAIDEPKPRDEGSADAQDHEPDISEEAKEPAGSVTRA